MMLHWALLKKNVADSVVLWSASALCMLLFGWIFVIINSVWDAASFQAMIDLLPDAIQKLSPVPLEQLISFDSRLSIFFEDPVIFVLLAAWCISRCSDTVSGQLSAGTMEMLLAQPITRRQAAFTPSFVAVVGMILLAASSWIGILLGVQTGSVESPPTLTGLLIPGTESMQAAPARTPLSELVHPAMLLPGLANFVCLGFFLCGLTTLLSAVDRYRWRTIGIAISIAIVQLVMEIVAQAIDALRWTQTLTFFRAYEPVRFVTYSVSQGGPQWTWFMCDEQGTITDLGVHGCNLILIVAGLACFTAAIIHFGKRDLPAPL